VKRKGSDAWRAVEPDASYTVVTSDYLATGGDGYATLARIHQGGKSVNTYLNYTQTFVDYVLARGSVTRPAASEYSHQSVITREGKRLP